MIKYQNSVASAVDGKPIYGAQVNVYQTSDGSLATIYADEAGTSPLGQPILTDQLGSYAFYVADGKYTITVMTGTVQISTTNITMVDALQLKERALLVPVNEDAGTLPSASARAGMLLGFDQSTGSPTALVANSFAGPTGASDSAFGTLAALKAIDPTLYPSPRLAAKAGSDGGVPNGLFNYQTSGAPYTADGVNIIALNSIPLTTGALVRQGAASIVTKRDAFARPRTQQERNDEVVSVLEYCAGDGVTDDTSAYQALVFRAPKEIYYPKGCRIKVTSQILWLGNCTHRFANDAGITSNVDGYGVLALGYPELLSATVTNPILQDAVSFGFSGVLGLSAGDDFYLYDAVTQEYDINVVRAVIGNTVYTKRPIVYRFATAANIRIYSLAGACRNVTVIGGEFTNSNPSIGAHGLGFLNAVDFSVSDATFFDTGGIGLGAEVSMRFLFRGVSALNTGAVGLGMRNAKDWTITDFVGRNPEHDESLTLYKNCSFGTINGADIEQYTFGNQPIGNAGLAGNCLLVDYNCSDIDISNIRLRGSATYALFVTNGSRRVTVDKFTISNANLGGIRFALASNDNRIGRGRITDIIDSADPQQGGIATAAIQDDSGCTGNILATDVTFARIAGGVTVRQGGARGTVVCAGNMEQRGGYLASATPDWNGSSAGTRIMLSPVGNVGNTYARVATETAGGSDYGATAISARSTAPGLQFDGDVIFSVTPSNITLTWRDFAGATHSATLPAA